MPEALAKVVILAGGTGGHVMPGLAVCQALRARGAVDIAWLGTQRGLEAKLVPQAGIKLICLRSSGLRGKSWLKRLTALANTLVALVQAVTFMRRFKPDLVIGFGGYVCGPGALSAWLLRIPLVIHEQNAIAGLTNRLTARLAKRVLASFPSSFAANVPSIHTGNPVREAILNTVAPTQRQAAPALRLLVLGGSQGAKTINETLVQALAQLHERFAIEVQHQTGSTHLQATQQAYAQQGIDANTIAFIEDMAAAYAWADLVISRAGATTVAELSAVGIASILIPYPYAVDDHQTQNAQYLVNAGAALMLPQSQLSAAGLAELIGKYAADKEQLHKMAEAAYRLPGREATELVVANCLEVMNDYR